jgi:hypothetical protein
MKPYKPSQSKRLHIQQHNLHKKTTLKSYHNLIVCEMCSFVLAISNLFIYNHQHNFHKIIIIIIKLIIIICLGMKCVNLCEAFWTFFLIQSTTQYSFSKLSKISLCMWSMFIHPNHFEALLNLTWLLSTTKLLYEICHQYDYSNRLLE